MVSHHLVGVAEVAELLGVSRQRVGQLARAHRDFPAPEAELAGGRIWSREAVLEWLARHPQRSPGRASAERAPFERLDDGGRRALIAAQAEAAAARHPVVGVEHLLVALAADPRCGAAEPLERAGLTARRARAALLRLVRPGAHPGPERRPLGDDVHRAVVVAGQAAGEGTIGGADLLSGLLEDPDGRGRKLLLAAGADPDRAVGVAHERSDPILSALREVAERLDEVRERLSALERAAADRS